MVSRDEILRDTRAWFNQPPATKRTGTTWSDKATGGNMCCFCQIIVETVSFNHPKSDRANKRTSQGRGGAGGGTGKKSLLSLIIGEY